MGATMQEWVARALDAVPLDRPVLIAGPTASGKSALALAIAQAQGRSVVNADALQVYARWRILTARPDAQDEALAPHLLYGHIAHDAEYSSGHWLRQVAEVLARDPRPVIVGGTGLNFMALTEGLVDIPATPPEIRVQASERLAQGGLAALVAGLDPVTRARIDTSNPARVQRAYEVLCATGRGLADWQADTPPPLVAPEAAHLLVLRPDPDWLGARIDMRFDAMIAGGALDEVRAELPRWDPRQPSSRAIGAPDLVAYLHGTISLAQATAQAKTASRQYAKRQRTWFRNRIGHWPGLVPKD